MNLSIEAHAQHDVETQEETSAGNAKLQTTQRHPERACVTSWLVSSPIPARLQLEGGSEAAMSLSSVGWNLGAGRRCSTGAVFSVGLLSAPSTTGAPGCPTATEWGVRLVGQSMIEYASAVWALLPLGAPAIHCT